MKVLQFALVGCLIVGLAGCGSPTTKGKAAATTTGGPAPAATPNKDKILGTWELVKGEGAPPGTLAEYTKDGKVKVTVKAGGKEMKMEGTYSVEGDTLKTTMKGPGGKEETDKDKIEKLTETQLVLKNMKENKTVEFKKK